MGNVSRERWRTGREHRLPGEINPLLIPTMEKLKDVLRNRTVEAVLLLAAYPITLLGGKLGAWLEKGILSTLTAPETFRLLGSILGLLLVACSYIMVLLVRASKRKDSVCIWRTVEFRKGPKTLGQWIACCPKCHLPANVSEMFRMQVHCSGNCGWISEMDSEEVKAFLDRLEKEL